MLGMHSKLKNPHAWTKAGYLSVGMNNDDAEFLALMIPWKSVGFFFFSCLIFSSSCFLRLKEDQRLTYPLFSGSPGSF